jgi:type IV secretion system protein VirB6
MPSFVYQDTLAYVNTVCSGYIGASVAGVASAIAPAAYTLLGLYVILWGLASMRGLIQEPITDAAIRAMKIAFIFGVGIGLASYNVYVTDTFFNAPERLAASLKDSTSNTSAIASLDKILDQGFDIGNAFWAKGGLIDGDFGMYLIACFVWVMTILVTAYACFLIVLAKIALSLVISLGPLFIFSLLFQPTGTFFNSWIQQLANYALLTVLAIMANVFVMDLFVDAADQARGVNRMAEIDRLFPFFVTGGVSLLVLAQIPSIAAGLAGGISLSSYGVGRLGFAVLSRPFRDVAGATYNKSKDVAKRGTKYMARKSWQYTGGTAWNAYKNRSNTLSRT